MAMPYKNKEDYNRYKREYWKKQVSIAIQQREVITIQWEILEKFYKIFLRTHNLSGEETKLVPQLKLVLDNSEKYLKDLKSTKGLLALLGIMNKLNAQLAEDQKHQQKEAKDLKKVLKEVEKAKELIS
jgi:hypothetical protein